MKKIFLVVFLSLLFCSTQNLFAQTYKADSTAVETESWKRLGTRILGYTDFGGRYRIVQVDTRGALRDASFDSLTVDTLTTVAMDTIVIDDDYSFSPSIKARVDLKIKTNTMGEWIYLEAGDWITLPFVFSNGDTLFVSAAATLPEFQMIRGRMK